MTSLLDRSIASAAKAVLAPKLRRFLMQAENSAAVQLQVMRAFCRLHAESDFGREHALSDIDDWRSFRTAIPTCDYEALRPYLERVVNGEYKALLGPGEKPFAFAMSSGSTGAPKYVPVTKRYLAAHREAYELWGTSMFIRRGDKIIGPFVPLAGSDRLEITPSGLPAGLISGMQAMGQRRVIRRSYPVPPDCCRIEDDEAKTYVTMRMAIDKNPSYIVTVSPMGAISLASCADRRAEQLIRDVRDGSLDPALEMPAHIRGVCESRLSPNPEMSRRLEELVRKNERLLPKDYWNLNAVCTWIGGTVGLLARNLPEYYGDVPTQEIGLIASEGRMTIPLAGGTSSGVLDIAHNVFEFIPESDYDSTDPVVVLPHELEIGERYYILVTNCAGIFRYDIGDLVECTGMVGSTPELAFLSRGQRTANMTVEKLTEHQLVEAVGSALPGLAFRATNFVAAPVADTPPYYRLNIDLAPDDGRPSIPDRQLATRVEEVVEHQLQQLNRLYAGERMASRLGPVRVRVVPGDWLERVRNEQMARIGAGVDGYKQQFLYTEPGQDDALLDLTRSVC